MTREQAIEFLDELAENEILSEEVSKSLQEIADGIELNNWEIE